MEQDKNLTAEIQQEETLVGTIPPVTFDEFTPPSYEEWKQEVVTALKGGSFEKSMFTKTYEGITLNPIYRLEDQERITHNKTYPGMESNLRGANAGGYIHKVWTIAQECDGKTPAEANEMVKYELLKVRNRYLCRRFQHRSFGCCNHCLREKRSGPRKITWRYYCRSDWRTCFGRRISSSAGRIL